MTQEIQTPPMWKPSAQTRVAVHGFVAMHGGPKAMSLAEHEHTEIQIEAHFSAAALSRGSAIAHPDLFRLIPSGKPHVGSWKDGSEVVVLLLDQQQIDIASDELLTRGKFKLNAERWGTDNLIQSIASILRSDFLSATSDPLYLEAVRTILSGYLARSFGDDRLRQTRGRLPPPVLRRALEMMHEKLGAGVSIDEVASRCGMGVHQFTRLFKASMGSSPYQFIMQLKISRAKDLLAKTATPLVEIAYELGFASQSHFSTSFRQHTQLSPQQYRSLARR